MSELRHWLEGIGVGQYAEAFEANEIDMELYRFATMLLNNRLALLTHAEKVRLAFYK